MTCDFCTILKNSENAIYQDELITVLLDIDPISKGHVIILPNQHYLDIDEIPNETLLHIMKFSKEYVKMLKRLFNPMGYSIMQNGGFFNDIHHFHLHVFPRFSVEDFGWTYNKKTSKEAEELKKRLLSEIARQMAKISKL